MNPKVVLGICTLQYEKRCVDSLLGLVSQFPFEGWSIPESSLIHFSRNKIVWQTYENCPDFTHILFIDDDMTDFDYRHVLRLLQADKDIVAALCTTRKYPWKLVTFFDDVQDNEVLNFIKEEKVVEIPAVGMAFTLIKREVFDKMREETVGKPVWFTMDRFPRADFPEEVEDFISEKLKKDHYDRIEVKDLIKEAIYVGQTSHLGTGLIGEDIAFCRRAREADFTVWVDCGCPIGHVGQETYDFRYAFQAAADNENHPVEQEVIQA